MATRPLYMVLESRSGHRPTPCNAGDHFATIERGAGGMTHLQSLLWMRGSQEIYLAARGQIAKEAQKNIDLSQASECVAAVAGYFKNSAAEVRPLIPEMGEENKARPARKSRKAGRQTALDPRDTAWGDLRRQLESGCEDSEEPYDERAQMVGLLADFSNMRDWREPHSTGPKSRNQPCAKFANGRSIRITNIRIAAKRPHGNAYRLELRFSEMAHLCRISSESYYREIEDT